VQDQPGDLVPVEAVGFDLGHRPGDAERVSRATRQVCTSSSSSSTACVVMIGPSSKFLNFSITLVINHQS
jgi:hypothetical protein